MWIIPKPDELTTCLLFKLSTNEMSFYSFHRAKLQNAKW